MNGGPHAHAKVPKWRRRLYLPAYKVGDAARYSRISSQSVRRWCELLTERRKGERLSYFELIEVAVVASFRSAGVSLQRIRKTREFAAQVLNEEHPFAHLNWKTEGRHLMVKLREIEDAAELDNLVLGDEHGQLTWADVIAERFTEFDYEEDLALRWHVGGKASGVTIDPRIRFGAPTVDGIPTWVLRGRWEAGEGIDEIEEDFGLSREVISHGLSFEGIQNAA